MLRKIGRGGPPLLLKNRKRLCFPDAWLRAALQHVLGRLLSSKGVFCPVPCVRRDMEEVTGSSTSLEDLSRLIPLNALGGPQARQVVRPNQDQKVPPSHCGLPAWGVAPCCPLLIFCRALSCQLLLPDVSLWFSPCLAALLKILGSKYLTAGASELPWGLHGGRDSPFAPSRKVPFGCGEERKTQAGVSPASALQSFSCRYK